MANELPITANGEKKLKSELNQLIKVDREERPDIDKIYQMSQSIITGKNGGWPLTIFMDHNKFPFFV